MFLRHPAISQNILDSNVVHSLLSDVNHSVFLSCHDNKGIHPIRKAGLSDGIHGEAKFQEHWNEVRLFVKNVLKGVKTWMTQ